MTADDAVKCSGWRRRKAGTESGKGLRMAKEKGGGTVRQVRAAQERAAVPGAEIHAQGQDDSDADGPHLQK